MPAGNTGDAFGHAIEDFYRGDGGYEIVEREDGLFEIGGGPAAYFAEYRQWPDYEKKAMKYVRGAVLDVGCGAGRHSLYLQERGFDVLGIDSSPRAMEVCRQRGLKRAEVVPLARVDRQLGVFDTVLMLGNTLALLDNMAAAKRILKRLGRVTSREARIIGQTRDPYQTDIEEHLEFHRRNRSKGLPPGQARIRIRYKKYVTPWLSYLFLSKEEMTAVLEDTGWHLESCIDGPGGIYVAILCKK
ncbi:MAG: class I SAM-dependent methyltransferase [candidate division Zixibacteria bacterium]|nr:class I SAM-dependent methyltransferase [candidate division Zixibacteria bacterium]